MSNTFQKRAELVRLMTVVSRIQFPGVHVELEHKHHGRALRVHCPDGVCTVTGEPAPWVGRPWPIDLSITNGDLVQTAFKAIMTAVEHEVREQFKFQGETVMNPHRTMELIEVYDGEFSVSP